VRIVVTGGAGFVGKHLLDWLVGRGHEALVIDDFSTGRIAHLPLGVAVERRDLTEVSAKTLAALLSDFGAQGVVHLAAMHFIPDCMARPERTFQVNTQVTHTLVEALAQHPVQRIAIASTMDVYAVADRPHAETDTLEPANVYGLSKALSEEIIGVGLRRGAFSSAIALRLANVYGPNETNPHLIPDVVQRLLNRTGDALMMGYLGASRDFVFVKEVAAAFGTAVTAGPDGFHRLNVGTGRPVAVRHVVRTLQRLLGDDRPMREDEAVFRVFDRLSLTPQVAAIEAVLGWRATWALADGLAEVVQHMVPSTAKVLVDA